MSQSYAQTSYNNQKFINHNYYKVCDSYFIKNKEITAQCIINPSISRTPVLQILVLWGTRISHSYEEINKDYLWGPVNFDNFQAIKGVVSFSLIYSWTTWESKVKKEQSKQAFSQTVLSTIPHNVQSYVFRAESTLKYMCTWQWLVWALPMHSLLIYATKLEQIL